MNSKSSTLLLIIFVFSTIFSFSLYSQTDEEKRAMYLFNIAYGIKWENHNDIVKFSIGVFSSNIEYTAIKDLAKSRTMSGKPVEVIRYDKYEDIKEHHIIYITINENANLGLIYDKFKGENVLIISDRSKEPQYSVINFRNFEQGAQKFNINKSAADTQRLKLSNQLLKLGGDREVLQEIYAETNRSLREHKKLLEQKEKEIKEKDELINYQRKEIEELKKKLSESEK